MSLALNQIHYGDARVLLKEVEKDSIACSIWSPPYHVGKDYEKEMSFQEWRSLLKEVIKLHFPIIKPGGFIAINIADILCFRDEAIPRIQAMNVKRQTLGITREKVLAAMKEHPNYNRYQLAKVLGCSEQTVDRRLHGNNVRGGKYNTQTRVQLVGSIIEEAGMEAGLYLYDRRIWVKDPAWQNSKWHTLSYRSVDEFEYIYIFWTNLAPDCRAEEENVIYSPVQHFLQFIPQSCIFQYHLQQSSLSCHRYPCRQSLSKCHDR